MNQYTQHSVAGYISEISAGKYNAGLLKNLIVDIRDYSAKKSIIREFGDFLAHPEARDKGIVHSRFKSAASDLKRFFDVAHGKATGSARFEIRPCFNSDEIFEDLLVSAKALCPNEVARCESALRAEKQNIVCCLLVLIQGARFKIGARMLEAYILLAPDGQNNVLSGRISFMGSVPSEIVTGDKFIDFAFPLIVTDLYAKQYSGIPVNLKRIDRILYCLEGGYGKPFSLFPIEK